MLNRDHYVERIVDAVMEPTFDTMDPEVVDAARLRIADSIACALSGRDTEAGQLSWRVATTDHDRSAMVIGRPGTVSLESAAFCNTAAMRSEDYNDSYNEAGSGHPSDLIGTAMAVGAFSRADAGDLVAAVVGAYDALCRSWDHFKIGRMIWDQGTMVGPVAAALAARLLGLDRVQAGHAVSIAAVSTISVRQTRQGQLSVWKNLATAQASKEGVAAALLAAAGAEGPDQPYVGRFGIATALGRNPGELELAKGAILQTTLKLMPAGYHAHVPVELAIMARPEVDLQKVTRIRVSTYAKAIMSLASDPDKWRPTTHATADHSLPYLVASGLRFGQVDDASFTEERLHDPDTQALMDKVEVDEDPAKTERFPDSASATLEVWQGGSWPVSSRTIDHPKGHHRRPATAEELESKFVDRGQRASARGDVRAALRDLYKTFLTMDEGTDTGSLVERVAEIVGA